MAEKAKDNNNMIIMAAVAGAVIILGVGGYMYQKQQSTKTVSVEMGGKSLSATFSE